MLIVLILFAHQLILTNFGSYEYEKISLDEAKEMISDVFQSAIGHQSTAEILTTLLELKVEMNRIQYEQAVNDVALVFKLNGRPAEGQILTVKEIQEIGFSFGKLTRIK